MTGEKMLWLNGRQMVEKGVVDGLIGESKGTKKDDKSEHEVILVFPKK